MICFVKGYELLSNKNNTDIIVLNGRAPPVVQVVRQTASTDLEQHAFFLNQVFVLEDVNHVEYIVAFSLSVSHHALEEVLLAFGITILDNIVKTVGGVDLVVSRSDSVTMLVLEVNILRSGSSEGLSLLLGISEEFEAAGGESVERAEVRDGLVLFIINNEGVDDTFLGE